MYIDSEYICSHCRTKKSKEMEQGEGNNKLWLQTACTSLADDRGHKQMLMGPAGDVGTTSVTSQVLLIELETT